MIPSKCLLGFLSEHKFLTMLMILFMILLILEPSHIVTVCLSINYNALALIILLILVSKSLISSGFINNLAIYLIKLSSNNAYTLTITIILSTFLISTLATNDGAVLIMIPLILTISRLTKLSKEKLVVIVLLAANIGSTLTPMGNPQNLIIWQHYRLSIRVFLHVSAIVSLTFLLALIAFFILTMHGKAVTGINKFPKIRTNWKLAISSLVLLGIGIFLGEVHLSYYALLIAFPILYILKRDFYHVMDFGLITVFALMFVVFTWIAILIDKHIPTPVNCFHVYVLAVLFSQMISNVPATIVLTHITTSWIPLFIGANLGGCITPIGSMANIIGLKLTDIRWKTYISETAIFSLITIPLGLLLVYLLE